VKRCRADGSASIGCARVGRCQDYARRFGNKAPGFFFSKNLVACESPDGLAGAVVSLSFPCCYFVTHHANVWNATVKASGLQYAQFDSGHIEPTAMLSPSFTWPTGNSYKT
jgi:hypothetical protein